jgi:glucose/arabinose dehydrogenase
VFIPQRRKRRDNGSHPPFLSYLLSLCQCVRQFRILFCFLGSYKSPTKIIFSNDGTLWATDKNGLVSVADPNEYNNPRTVLDISNVVCETGERGLESVAPHPNFDTTTNPYIWVFYSFNKHGGCAEDGTTGAVMRLSRFTCMAGGNSNDCDINSEMVFLETGSFPFDHHNGGEIAFGKDGLLYATIGDGGEMDTAQQRHNLFGTIVRLNPDNTIPATNPYVGEANSVRCGMVGGYSGDVDAKCSEIFAYGVRNPFRLLMNPNVDHVEFYLCDVGAGMWEEVTIGGARHAGANYGWPVREGPCKLGRNCNDDCSAQKDYLDPLHYYGHNVDGDGAIIGGAFVPNWGHWPTSYEDKFIYADFVIGSLYLMNPSTVGESRNSCPARSGYDAKEIVSFSSSYPVSMAFNPLDGHLYFVIRSFGGKLNRVRYVGNNPSSTWQPGTTTTPTDGGNTTSTITTNSTVHVNRAPQPMIQVSSTGGPAGTVVEFDGSTSTDPDADVELLFEWDFDGDGIIDSTNVTTSHQYNTNGMFMVSLRVRDGKGGRATSYIEIGIGEYPVADILVPAKGEKFQVGQIVQLTGTFFV